MILMVSIEVFEEINFCATGSSESQIIRKKMQEESGMARTLERGSLC